MTKVLPPPIRYPLIALLCLVFFIGIVTILYERNWLPLTGPFIAMAAVPVILLTANWWRGRKLVRKVTALSSQLMSLRAKLVSIGQLPPEWPKGSSEEVKRKQNLSAFKRAVLDIDLALNLIGNKYYAAAIKAINNLAVFRPELSQTGAQLDEKLGSILKTTKELEVVVRKLS